MAARLNLVACMGLALGLAACAPLQPKPAAGPSTADLAFRALAGRYLDDRAALYPVEASRLGDHRHDDALDDLSAGGREERANLARRYLAALASIDHAALAPANEVDARLLARLLESQLWNLMELEELRWNPLLYTELAGDAIRSLMERGYAPLPQRLRAATARLESLPKLLAQEREALVPERVPRVHADAAVRQNAGLALTALETVATQANALEGEDRARLMQAIAAAKTALSQHQIWLARRLLPAAGGDPRLGAARFDQAMKFALDSPLPRAALRARAEAALASTRSEMYGLARELLRGQPGAPALPDAPSPEAQQSAIAAALELAYAERPARTSLLEHARQAVDEAQKFVAGTALITQYGDPIEVAAMPAYRRGVVPASCEAPGPGDAGQTGFYYVAPIPPEYPAAQADSYLREYNDRALREQALELVAPGHCLQAAHANRADAAEPGAAALRALLSSAPFTDGWALYAAQVAIEQGFQQHDPLLRLIDLKRELRSIADALLDQAVHADGITREAAMHLLAHDAFQEEREASANWIRVELTPARTSASFVGAEELRALRVEAEQRWGPDFSLRRFHDAVLSCGAPPVRYLRALVFGLPLGE